MILPEGFEPVSASDDGVDDIISIDIKSDGSIGNIIEFNLTGKNCPLVEPNTEKPAFITMNGKEVYKFVVRILPEYIEEIIAKAGLKAEDVDYLIPHQANLRIIEAVKQRLNFSDSQCVVTVQKYGNTSSASIPMAMNDAYENNRLQNGSLILLDAFGGGFTWGSALLYFGGK